MYRVYFRSQALKALESLQKSAQRKIVSALKEMAQGRWEGVDLKKVKGVEHGWRLRVGRWRVLYLVVTKNKTIEVVDIFLKKSESDYLRKRGLF